MKQENVIHHNIHTGEMIRCKICDNGATVFLSGLFPLCPSHGTRALELHNCNKNLTVHEILYAMLEEAER